MLGIGSGWFERDYDEYGYEFGTAGQPPPRPRPRPADHQGALGEAEPAAAPRDIPILIGGGGEKVTLRIVAEHADVWHTFGDLETLRHKSQVLDDWCAKVGRDPGEIQRSSTIARLTGELSDPSPLLELGFTDFVVSAQGPNVGPRAAQAGAGLAGLAGLATSAPSPDRPLRAFVALPIRKEERPGDRRRAPKGLAVEESHSDLTRSVRACARAIRGGGRLRVSPRRRRSRRRAACRREARPWSP